MPDLCMCKNNQCPKKENCYRYKATPFKPYQSYANFESICTKGNNYEWFYEMYIKYDNDDNDINIKD